MSTVLPRGEHAFFELGHFALSEAEREMIRPGIGSVPERAGIVERFETFLDEGARRPGIPMLRQSLDYVRNELSLDASEFVHEMVDGILGDHYPVPDRILTCSEHVIRAYLSQEMASPSTVS